MMNERTFIRSGLSVLFVLTLLSGFAVARAAAREWVPAVRPPAAVEAQIEEIPDWLARWELARVLSYLKQYDDSVAEYRKLIREKPALAEARLEMAQVLFWQGKADDALVEMEKVPSAQMNDGSRELMADLYRSQKHYDRAEPLYRSILGRSPDNHKARLKLAEMLSWLKRYDESLSEYGKILAKRPLDIQVRRKYAFVLIWAGRHAEAARELKQTLP
jgi:tetratricopeptide (TPR) repeat protein